MNGKKKFSKDPKVKIISLKNFLDYSNYLCDDELNFWNDDERPMADQIYYKLTSNYLIIIKYTKKIINFGMGYCEKLEEIRVAYRNGKKEYELFDKRLLELQEKRKKYKRNIRLDRKIEQIKKARELLPEYRKPTVSQPKQFANYLIDTGYKTSIESLKNKYLVFDVETNGTRKANDDLLSLSIYDPTTGVCYNRYFPLDLQPLILTTFINGITEKTLENATHMTQEELNQIIDFFHIKERILLSYSGGKGLFDSTFVINYCKRHNIVGFEGLQYENIKSKIPYSGFGTEGLHTKDNLCRLFQIQGVEKLHSGLNDCVLEWKLYEKVSSGCCFFVDQNLYRFNPGYIVPYSYLIKFPTLAEAAGIKIPIIESDYNLIFKLSFPKNSLKKLKKFQTNITGITLEHAINSMLKVEKKYNYDFLLSNKSKLEYIGGLYSRIKKIPISEEENGMIKTLAPEYDEYINEINRVTKIMMQYMNPLIDFIRNNIFKNEKILSQQLNISQDKKVLALSDLSSSKAVMEIKTYDILTSSKQISSDLATQLYYQANGRATYALSIVFDFEEIAKTSEKQIKSINIYIYKIYLKKTEYEHVPYEKHLWNDEIDILNEIIKNPSINKIDLSKKTEKTTQEITRIIKKLIKRGYIIKTDRKKDTPWTILETYKGKPLNIK